jgi:hypothetical protein
MSQPTRRLGVKTETVRELNGDAAQDLRHQPYGAWIMSSLPFVCHSC